jgi:hypothetical protein
MDLVMESKYFRKSIFLAFPAALIASASLTYASSPLSPAVEAVRSTFDWRIRPEVGQSGMPLSGTALPNPHDQTSPYSTDMGPASTLRVDWMKNIDDATHLLDMSIPGAHNEWFLAKNSTSGKTVQPAAMQVRKLDEQMGAGLRAFDATLHCDKLSGGCTTFTSEDSFLISNVSFSDALDQIGAFLEANPTETIILRLSKIDKKDPDIDFWGRSVLNQLKGSHAAPYIWVPRDQTTGNLATLGDVRGRLVILRDWNGIITKEGKDLETYGMDMHLHVTPHSLFAAPMGMRADLYARWAVVKQQISYVGRRLHAQAGSGEGAMTYATAYAGGSLDAYPFFAASGYSNIEGSPQSTGNTAKPDNPGGAPDFMRGACTHAKPSYCSIYYTGLNFLLNDALGTTGNSRAFNNNPLMHGEKRLGIVMMDFPGDSLVKAIIEAN